MRKIIILFVSILFTVSLQAQKINAKITDSVNVTCMGDSNGSAAVQGIGGYTPYTYLWEPGGQTTDTATGLAAGTYTATVIDTASDTAEAIATIGTAAPPIVVATSSSEPSCFGMSNGAVAVTFITGGTAPFLIEWLPIMNNNDTVTGLPASTYTAQVTDANGCQVQNPVPVSQPTPLVLTSTIIANAVQALTSGGTPPYTYKWYPPVSTSSSVTGLSAGTYTITVRDSNNCFDSTAVIVPSVISLPSLTIYLPWQGQGSITCWAPSYFYFPIMAEADSTERFNNCVVDIKISGLFWGDDSANGGITVTQGGQFQPGTGNDYNILNVTNLSDSIIQIEFGSPADTSPNGTIIPTYNPYLPNDTLLNVRLEMQTCGITPLVTFADTAAVSSLSNYTVPAGTAFNYPDSALQFVCVCGHYACWNSTSSADSTCCCTDSFNYRHFDTVGYTSITQTIPYYKTTYIGSVDEPPLVQCYPIITDFTHTINAGTNAKSVPPSSSIMYIWGTGFGNKRDSIQVRNADGPGMVALDSSDILLWTNNLIKVRMPGVLIKDYWGTPGTGPFIVYNTCGESVSSADLTINYSIEDETINHYTEKIRPNIVMSQDTTSILWRCDTSIWNNPRALACTKKAIKTWNCYTGVNWKLSPDTIILETTKNDSISVIYFSNSGTNFETPRTLMQTKRWTLPDCNSAAADSVGFYDEADIQIRRDTFITSGKRWSYDMTYTQLSHDSNYFYDDILHELGHAHGLNHINDTLSLMNWYHRAGQRDSIPGGKNPGPQTLYGAFDMINTSVAYPPNCFNDTILVTSTTQCIDPDLSAPVVSAYPNNLDLFPDPANEGTITINYQLTKDSYIQFKIVDCTGRIILNLDNTYKVAGNYSEEVNVSKLAKAIYLFTANINGQLQVIKFIKL